MNVSLFCIFSHDCSSPKLVCMRGRVHECVCKLEWTSGNELENSHRRPSLSPVSLIIAVIVSRVLGRGWDKKSSGCLDKKKGSKWREKAYFRLHTGIRDLPLWFANPRCKDGLYSEAFPRQLLSDTPGVKKIFKLLLKCNIKTFNQTSSTHQPPSHSTWVSLVVSRQALAANEIHNCSFSLLSCAAAYSKMPTDFLKMGWMCWDGLSQGCTMGK